MSTSSDLWGEHFTADERALLAPFVTDLDSAVFGLCHLPEVVKGALFSRYSRTDKSLRRILLDEFIQSPESGFAALVGQTPQADQLVAVQQAEAFYDRVLVGYGDDSVAELGGAHVACEQVSNIAAKALEDARIGISPLEKSTRYVVFNRKVDGQYRYLREAAIMQSGYAARYAAAMDGLFDTYTELLQPTLTFVRDRTPRDEQTSERAYASATRAKACDLLRGLLPMAALTNVGLFGNGRAFEYLLTKLYASDLAELRALAESLQRSLDALIPSFVKRARSERGRQQQIYLQRVRQQLAELARHYLPESAAGTQVATDGVTLVSYDADAEIKTVAALLYPHTDLPLETVLQQVRALSTADRLAIIQAGVGERSSRFHRPGRPFEEPRYSFDLLADLGAYRDLQRHRLLTQERQHYSVRHGFVTPHELEEAGLSESYARALEAAAETVETIATELPEPAQYAVPLAFRVRWRVSLNLRELYHLAELRSSPQGHPAYRAIAQAMYQRVQEVHPALAEGMRFVDLHDYALERLDAERRLDAKLAALQNKG